MNIHALLDFLEPVNLLEISEDEGFKPTQVGSYISAYENDLPDVADADLVIVGCGEYRGAGIPYPDFNAANAVRKAFYQLFHWQKNIKIVDIGNVKCGNKINDSRAALQTVLSALGSIDKKVVVIGGAHDNTIAQSNAFKQHEKLHEIICIDATIDLNKDTAQLDESFLLNLFTESPNYIKHYNHIGFQSYFVQPDMLETIDKLRFDCVRLGKVKEDFKEIEPVFRNSHLLSLDIRAFAHAFAPASSFSPNGFNGEEMCTLFKYAGMSKQLTSIGIYGYEFAKDTSNLTAKQLSHCLWYLVSGIYEAKQEANFEDTQQFNEFHLAFAEAQFVFVQSKKTNRWWMKMPNNTFLACSYNDYYLAAHNEIPERWLRAIEREA